MALATVLAALEPAVGTMASALALILPLLPLFAVSDREVLACHSVLQA